MFSPNKKNRLTCEREGWKITHMWSHICKLQHDSLPLLWSNVQKRLLDNEYNEYLKVVLRWYCPLTLFGLDLETKDSLISLDCQFHSPPEIYDIHSRTHFQKITIHSNINFICYRIYDNHFGWLHMQQTHINCSWLKFVLNTIWTVNIDYPSKDSRR